jgi:hypothetical protein
VNEDDSQNVQKINTTMKEAHNVFNKSSLSNTYAGFLAKEQMKLLKNIEINTFYYDN